MEFWNTNTSIVWITSRLMCHHFHNTKSCLHHFTISKMAHHSCQDTSEMSNSLGIFRQGSANIIIHTSDLLEFEIVCAKKITLTPTHSKWLARKSRDGESFMYNIYCHLRAPWIWIWCAHVRNKNGKTIVLDRQKINRRMILTKCTKFASGENFNITIKYTWIAFKVGLKAMKWAG